VVESGTEHTFEMLAVSGDVFGCGTKLHVQVN
jgi:hypothetical protein